MGGALAPKCRLAVVKIASRCNLNCSYCYMYNMGDETYRDQPKVMSDAVVNALVAKCVEHCNAHGISQFTFALHGGEPLLAGLKKFEGFIAHARERMGMGGIKVRFVVQTNGVLLDDVWCQSLKKAGVAVGISIDGPASIHDRKRVTHQGKGSYESVIAGFRCAQKCGLTPGLLTVIDPASNPSDAYDHFKALQPSRIDFLLPEGNHVQPPIGLGATNTPYADWLLAVFERWWAEDAPFSARLFEQIIGAVLGVPFRSDALGGQENELLVFETNGEIGPVDVLRAAVPGSSCTGINVLSHSLDEAFRNHSVSLYHSSHNNFCSQCRRCPINKICGGGYLSHRFALGTGFDNPSVYCRDLTTLIVTLRERAISILPSGLQVLADVRSMSITEVFSQQCGELIHKG